jgi:hypothetical protein
MTIALAVPALLGFFGGGALPPGLFPALVPSAVVAGLRDADALAAQIASLTPAVCKATDAPLDRVFDAYDGSFGSGRTFLRRAADDLAAAADSVCASAAMEPNTAPNRLEAVFGAIAAARRANEAASGANGLPKPLLALDVPKAPADSAHPAR